MSLARNLLPRQHVHDLLFVYSRQAIQDAVETAQRGGCGIIAYYRKEGRALGEVTKFRVYNSRKYQVGGDRPDTYFEQTANIAGIEDARVKEL